MNLAQEIQKGRDFLTTLVMKQVPAAGGRFETSKLGRFDLIGSAGYLPADKCHDVDFLLVLYGEYYKETAAKLVANEGFLECGEAEYSSGGAFKALRHRHLNIIVCEDLGFYFDYLAAYHVCKALNLQSKADRVLVHCLVRDKMSLEDSQTEALRWADEAARHTRHNILNLASTIGAFGQNRQLWGA